MMESQQLEDIRASEDDLNQFCLSKLRFDSIKEEDLKIFFEVLMVSAENRTVADLDTLVKILLHIEPIKHMNNISAVFLIARKLILTKYKSKQIIFQNLNQSEHLFVILNGKVALLRKSNQYFDSDQVVFLASGSCFGKIYSHSTSYIALAVEESLVAVLSRKDYQKIPIQLQFDRKTIIEQLVKTDLFGPLRKNLQLLDQVSRLLSINKLPLGSHIIREGQIPKALFFVLKGLIKKSVTLPSTNSPHSKQLQTKRYTSGDYFPHTLYQPLTFNLITQSICQLIIIPKKVLKIMQANHLLQEKHLNILMKSKTQENCYMKIANINSEENCNFYTKQLRKKKQWKNYREVVVEGVIRERDSRKKFVLYRS